MFYTFSRRKPYILFALATVLTACGGCHSTVLEVRNEPFLAVSKNADLNRITEKIAEAGYRRKYEMKVIAPGHIEAVFVKRDIRAVMDIKYTTEHFSITYKDSSGLGYDPADNTINSHYNRWVKNLKSDISRIYPSTALYKDPVSPKTHDTTKTELMPPKPELTDSI